MKNLKMTHKSSRMLGNMAPEIKRFTEVQKRALAEVGFTAIYLLTGQSVDSLKRSGRKFASSLSIGLEHYTDWHFAEKTSRLSEVAINPRRPFLKNSDSKIFTEQLDELGKCRFNFRSEKGVEGLDIILSDAPDYIELNFLHFEKTGQFLFGLNTFDHTRTRSLEGGYGICVGPLERDGSLTISRYSLDIRQDYLMFAPIVIPV